MYMIEHYVAIRDIFSHGACMLFAVIIWEYFPFTLVKGTIKRNYNNPWVSRENLQKYIWDIEIAYSMQLKHFWLCKDKFAIIK